MSYVLYGPTDEEIRRERDALRRELALAQEARLAAELRAEGLRGDLVDLCREWSVLSDPHSRDHSQALERLIAAPPPGLGPLRNLVRVAGEVLLIAPEADYVPHTTEHEEAYYAALAAYPALDPGAEPAGEVPRG